MVSTRTNNRKVENTQKITSKDSSQKKLIIRQGGAKHQKSSSDLVVDENSKLTSIGNRKAVKQYAKLTKFQKEKNPPQERNEDEGDEDEAEAEAEAEGEHGEKPEQDQGQNISRKGKEKKETKCEQLPKKGKKATATKVQIEEPRQQGLRQTELKLGKRQLMYQSEGDPEEEEEPEEENISLLTKKKTTKKKNNKKKKEDTKQNDDEEEEEEEQTEVLCPLPKRMKRIILRANHGGNMKDDNFDLWEKWQEKNPGLAQMVFQSQKDNAVWIVLKNQIPSNNLSDDNFVISIWPDQYISVPVKNLIETLAKDPSKIKCIYVCAPITEETLNCQSRDLTPKAVRPTAGVNNFPTGTTFDCVHKEAAFHSQQQEEGLAVNVLNYKNETESRIINTSLPIQGSLIETITMVDGFIYDGWTMKQLKRLCAVERNSFIIDILTNGKSHFEAIEECAQNLLKSLPDQTWETIQTAHENYILDQMAKLIPKSILIPKAKEITDPSINSSPGPFRPYLDLLSKGQSDLKEDNSTRFQSLCNSFSEYLQQKNKKSCSEEKNDTNSFKDREEQEEKEKEVQKEFYTHLESIATKDIPIILIELLCSTNNLLSDVRNGCYAHCFDPSLISENIWEFINQFSSKYQDFWHARQEQDVGKA